MHLLKRSDFGWGRTAARAASPRMGLVIHYDGPGQDLTKQSHSHCLAYWKGVREFHLKERGWADIGYSFGVCPHSDSQGNGYVFEGRGLGREQAAQPGGNTTYYSVTLMLGDGEHPTDVQINTVRELREWLHSKGNANTVKGHKDFFNTSCPGTILYKLVQDGTFTKKPGKVNTVKGNPLIGLKKGDEGQEVVALQELCKRAGRYDHIAASGGTDGKYGDGTAEDLRLIRKDAHSKAEKGFGDEVDGWAYSQLMERVVYTIAKKVATE